MAARSRRGRPPASGRTIGEKRISRETGVQDIRAYNTQGLVRFAKDRSIVGHIIDKSTEPDCAVCHARKKNAMGQTVVLNAPEGNRFLRISFPFFNKKECQPCHAGEASILGDLIVDVSLAGIDAHTAENRRKLI